MQPVYPAIVVPIYRLPLSQDEEFSLSVLRNVIDGRHPVLFAMPESLQTQAINLRKNEGINKFENSFFEGIAGYNRLLMSSCFYRAFEKFTHILIYQLDCLIFSDRLVSWCKKKFSYTAPPWFDNFNQQGTGRLWRVGNGGFSLRKVASFLRVLEMNVPSGRFDPSSGFQPDYTNERRPEYFRTMESNSSESTFCSVEEAARLYPYHEDLFWSFEAPKLDHEFLVCPARQALRFGFEVAPRHCFLLNWFRLPFGCHAWGKYDRAFWLGKVPKPSSKKSYD